MTSASEALDIELLQLAIGQRVVLATHNPGKLEEFRLLATALPILMIDFVSAGSLGLPEPVEDGTTYVQNARIKAHAAAKASGMIALADDSGLALDALDGQPGVYSADWTMTETGRDWALGRQKVEDALQAVGADLPERRAATFSSVLCLAHPDGRDLIVEGHVRGTYVWPPRGAQVMGFDCVFQPDYSSSTYGELHETHGRFGYRTHRGLAMERLADMARDGVTGAGR